jgi:hypothetical protein
MQTCREKWSYHDRAKWVLTGKAFRMRRFAIMTLCE